MRTMPIVAIVGTKNSGKTTLVVKLVQELVSRGYRVGTVKHGHHAFTVDQPGKDSWRHAEAGASAVFIVGGSRMALIREMADEPDPRDLAAMCPDMDIFLVEGYKRAPVPKIEVFSSPPGREPVCADDPLLLALACDDLEAAREVRPDIPHFHRDGAEEIARFIIDHVISPGDRG